MNDLAFVRRVVGLLDAADIQVWLFGGWGEELLGLVPARAHRDVDLLYPAATFDRVDALLSGERVLVEIPAKRFAHKRAFTEGGTMVEVFLVRSDARGYFTSLQGRVRHDWPADVFEGRRLGLRVASAGALIGYRTMVERRSQGSAR